jgi:hypothetical protein
MARYRKLPVEVEAVRVADYRDGLDRPEWMTNAIASGNIALTPSTLIVRTLEGDMRAQRDDYIICGTEGELYPCKPDIFATIYERAA